MYLKTDCWSGTVIDQSQLSKLHSVGNAVAAEHAC